MTNSDAPSYRSILIGLKAATTYEYKLGGSNGDDSVREFTTSLPTGIESVSHDENDVYEWYTLDGIRVEKPSKGIYIRVSGNERSKVII